MLVNFFSKNLYILVFITYIAFVGILTAFIPTPDVKQSYQLWVIFLFIVGSTVFSVYYWNKKRPVFHLNQQSLKQFSTVSENFILILSTVCLISIGWTCYKESFLLKDSFSYPLRMISTVFHPLVPLESRLFHTLIPFVLFLPEVNRAKRFVTWVLFSLIVFLLQVKIAPFYLLTIVTIKILHGLTASKIKKTVWITASALVTLSMFVFTYSSSKRGFESLNNSEGVIEKLNKKTPIVEVHAPNFYETCKFSPELFPTWLSKVASTVPNSIYQLIYRTLILPSLVNRLFVCSYQNDFLGYFRGHQVARVFGQYLPVYNILYRQFFPEHGKFTAANAVGIFVYDSIFQIGLFGLFLSILVVFTLIGIIETVSYNISNELGAFLKLTFLYSTLTSSILSILIFFIPTLTLLFWLYFTKDKTNQCVA